MRKIVLLILLLLTCSLSYGQAIDCVGNAGDTVCQSGSFRIDERLRLKSLPNTHALGVLTTNAEGLIILDTLDAATGVSIEILTDTSDAIHSWVWSIVSNPTIDSYLYATRAWHKKGMDSINVNVALKKDVSDSLPTTGYTTRARLHKVADSINAIIAALPTYSAGWGLTGSFAVDSQIVASRARLQKKVDSLIEWVEASFLSSETDPIFTGSNAFGIGAADISNWNDAYSNRITSLTTSGSSGAATLSLNTLNVPEYTLSGLGGVATATTSVNAVPIVSGVNNIISVGAGTVTNVIGGTNISITGTSTIQPTVNITGTIAVANGGTGTTSTTSVNTTPITYGANNTITVPIATGVTGLGTGVATWAATPSSANLASALTDETGSGLAVFATKPTFTGTIHPASAVAASAFDGSTGNYFTRTLTSSQTFTQSNFSTGQNFIVVLTQGSGTTYNPTWWSGITWVTSGGTAPTMTTTSNGITTYGFTCTGSNTFLGYLVGTQ